MQFYKILIIITLSAVSLSIAAANSQASFSVTVNVKNPCKVGALPNGEKFLYACRTNK